MKTSYKFTVRGELALEVVRTGTAKKGAITFKRGRDVFAGLESSLRVWISDPPAVPVDEGFVVDTQRLDVFDLVVKSWVHVWNIRERSDVLELQVSGDTSPGRSQIPPTPDVLE